MQISHAHSHVIGWTWCHRRKIRENENEGQAAAAATKDVRQPCVITPQQKKTGWCSYEISMSTHAWRARSEAAEPRTQCTEPRAAPTAA